MNDWFSVKPCVFIVDDDAAIREGLSLLIKQENLSVIAFDSAESFLACNFDNCRGCLIVDIHLPIMDGMQLQKVLCERGVGLPIIFLTGYGDVPTSVQAMKAGATDFLSKPVSKQKLMLSIHNAIQKYDQWHAQFAQSSEAKLVLEKLTAREYDVLKLILEGHRNKEIARFLGISFRTVELHRTRVFEKTNTNNLIELDRIFRLGQTGSPLSQASM